VIYGTPKWLSSRSRRFTGAADADPTTLEFPGCIITKNNN